MKKSIKFTIGILSTTIALSACGNNETPSSPSVQSSGSHDLRHLLISGAVPASSLKAQGIYIDNSTTAGSFMRNQISNDNLIKDSLRQIEVNDTPINAFDWNRSMQKLDDRSDSWDDRYLVDVMVPLKSDSKVIYHYKVYVEGGGNVDGYITSIYAREVVRVDGSANSTMRASYWDLAHADISTFVYTRDAQQAAQFGSVLPLSSGGYELGNDIAIPTSVRSAKYAMKPAVTGSFSAQSIIVSPVPPTQNPPPSVCGQSATSNGGVSAQGIIVCSIPKPTPPANDPVYVAKRDCRIEKVESDKAWDKYNGLIATTILGGVGVFLTPPPFDFASGAGGLGSMFAAREAGYDSKIARIKLNNCLDGKSP